MVNESDPIFEELKKHDIHLVSDEVIYPYAEDKDSNYDDVIHGDRLKNITLSVDYVPAVQPSDTLDIVNEDHHDFKQKCLSNFIKNLLSYNVFMDFNIPLLPDYIDDFDDETQIYAGDEMQFDIPDSDTLGTDTPLFNEQFEKIYRCSEYDPYSLVDLTSNFSKIIALPFQKINSDAKTYIPLNFIQNIFGKVGTGIGSTIEEAKTEALYECIEQYVKLQVISRSFTLERINEEYIEEKLQFWDTYRNLYKVIEDERLRVAFYDASLGGKYPVVCCAVFGSDDNNAPKFNFSFAADFDLDKAMKKSFLGALQPLLGSNNELKCEFSYDVGKVLTRKNLENLSVNNQGLVQFDIFKSSPDFALSPINRKLTTGEELIALIELISHEDKTIYFYTFNENYNVVRAVIPEFSEVRDPDFFEETNSNIGLMYQEFFNNLSSNSIAETGEFLESIKDNEISDETIVYDLLKLPKYGNNNLSDLTIGELKALIALHQEDYDAYLYWAEWAINNANKMNLDIDQNLHQCLIDYLKHSLSHPDEIEDYLELQELQYDSDTIEELDMQLSGRDDFFCYDTELKEFLNSDIYEDLIVLFITARNFNLKTGKMQ